MFTYRKSVKVIDSGPVITQPNQSFSVRQIIDQFARGEVIPTMYEATDSLSDDIDDDDLENIIEFEDNIDAEGHLLENQYTLFKNDSGKEQKDSNETGEGFSPASAETVG